MTTLTEPPRAFDPATVAVGVAHLRATDETLACVIEAVGPFHLALQPDVFHALAHAILGQQISVAAQAAVLKRVRALFAIDGDGFATPEQLRATPDEDLRAAGCSRQKIAYLKDLAAHVADRRLDLARLPALPDEAVIEALTAVKGIGRWTAEMVLIFSLGRLDVWPVDDLGIVDAVRRVWDLPAPPTRQDLVARAEPWRPYRTLASWYLWQRRRQLLGAPAR